ncbi:hypothetical protein TNCV_2913061 [Trichonephila clavipes]|nr:hypothetical protein TNCV_2913061 [Trichonephila clavipes]
MISSPWNVECEDSPCGQKMQLDRGWIAPFPLWELEIAISHQKNGSPGHDKISLQSINHLPIKAINLLLKSFNDSWSSSQIPKDWTHAIILSFIKPHKNPKEVSSYRPISLTSVLSNY